jgi:hypothetical protein
MMHAFSVRNFPNMFNRRHHPSLQLSPSPHATIALQVRIDLPYSLFPANGEMCLIVKDPQRVYKDRVSRAVAHCYIFMLWEELPSAACRVLSD